jgi:hypothetical protein
MIDNKGMQEKPIKLSLLDVTPRAAERNPVVSTGVDV